MLYSQYYVFLNKTRHAVVYLMKLCSPISFGRRYCQYEGTDVRWVTRCSFRKLAKASQFLTVAASGIAMHIPSNRILMCWRYALISHSTLRKVTMNNQILNDRPAWVCNCHRIVYNSAVAVYFRICRRHGNLQSVDMTEAIFIYMPLSFFVHMSLSRTLRTVSTLHSQWYTLLHDLTNCLKNFTMSWIKPHLCKYSAGRYNL